MSLFCLKCLLPPFGGVLGIARHYLFNAAKFLLDILCGVPFGGCDCGFSASLSFLLGGMGCTRVVYTCSCISQGSSRWVRKGCERDLSAFSSAGRCGVTYLLETFPPPFFRGGSCRVTPGSVHGPNFLPPLLGVGNAMSLFWQNHFLPPGENARGARKQCL